MEKQSWVNTREGPDQPESEMEGDQVYLNTILSHFPFKNWTYPNAADTALSSRGLSEANLLSWTGPPAPAELAMKPPKKGH